MKSLELDVDIDADCVPDMFEGTDGNDTAMRAYPIRPGAGFNHPQGHAGRTKGS